MRAEIQVPADRVVGADAEVHIGAVLVQRGDLHAVHHAAPLDVPLEEADAGHDREGGAPQGNPTHGSELEAFGLERHAAGTARTRDGPAGFAQVTIADLDSDHWGE